VFAVLVVIAFKKDIASGVILAGFMFVLYIPLGYMTDMAIYRFRQRRNAARG
jgi:cytochrome c biogenesis factor